MHRLSDTKLCVCVCVYESCIFVSGKLSSDINQRMCRQSPGWTTDLQQWQLTLRTIFSRSVYDSHYRVYWKVHFTFELMALVVEQPLKRIGLTILDSLISNVKCHILPRKHRATFSKAKQYKTSLQKVVIYKINGHRKITLISRKFLTSFTVAFLPVDATKFKKR